MLLVVVAAVVVVVLEVVASAVEQLLGSKVLGIPHELGDT